MVFHQVDSNEPVCSVLFEEGKKLILMNVTAEISAENINSLVGKCRGPGEN